MTIKRVIQKNRMLLPMLFLISIGIIIYPSCKKSNSDKLISANEGRTSHYTGKDCIICHKSGGSANSHFSVAGTVYSSNGNAEANATVKLHSQHNSSGKLIATINCDALGNFFTTEQIDLSAEIYATVNGSDGNSASKKTAITNGNCNYCHGNSTGKIQLK